MRDRSARAHTDTNINTAPQCGRQTLISGSDAVRATGSDSAGARAVVGRTVRFDDTEVPHTQSPLTRRCSSWTSTMSLRYRARGVTRAWLSAISDAVGVAHGRGRCRAVCVQSLSALSLDSCCVSSLKSPLIKPLCCSLTHSLTHSNASPSGSNTQRHASCNAAARCVVVTRQHSAATPLVPTRLSAKTQSSASGAHRRCDSGSQRLIAQEFHYNHDYHS